MKGVRHPFTGALYEPDGNGHVLVTLDGRSGLFTQYYDRQYTNR